MNWSGIEVVITSCTGTAVPSFLGAVGSNPTHSAKIKAIQEMKQLVWFLL